MKKILTIEHAIKITNELHKVGRRVVLAGGCFDLLHRGHINFLQKAKEQGDVLFVFLESDESIKKIKGSNRPINNQHDRAIILEELESVDYVIMLDPGLTDKDYYNMILNLKPAIIATTAGDIHREQKEKQAKAAGGRVVDVIDIVKDNSTTRLIKLLGEDL